MSKRLRPLMNALTELAEEADSQPPVAQLFENCVRRSVVVLECLGGAAYLPSSDGRYLTLAHWYEKHPAKKLKEFHMASKKLSLKQGPDIPGHVMHNVKKQWVMDYSRVDPQTHPRKDVAEGIGAVVSVPVVVYGRAAAVLEFFYRSPKKPDKELMQFLECVAGYAALAITRSYMKETMILQQEKFKRGMEDKINHLLQEKRKTEEASRATSEFLANISHELRTPMHAILSYADLGIKKLKQGDTEPLPKYFGSIHDSGNRLMALINNLLDLSKLEADAMRMEFAQHDLREIAHTVARELWPLLNNKRLILDIAEIPKIKTVVEADGFRIGQVILNLLSNAIKYSPERGTITITFEHRAWQDGSIDTPALAMLVIDHGPGLPPGEEEKVFDKFVQSSKTKTGAGGTGLGLAICRQIIEAHNGVIYAENNIDAGATFAFEIPLHQPEVCWLEEPDARE